jgi:3'-phosphoadenosine 5'-phosphosulfate sulfotransferase (PAPS reductase)/FAD synthetase
MMQARLHSRSREFSGRVAEAKRQVEKMAAQCPTAYVAWSAGKDSTALVHLVCVGCGVKARAMSVKDDLDFPGEEAYLTEHAKAFGVELDILRPPFSLQDWLAANAVEKGNTADMHSRSSSFADAAFYSLISEYSTKHGVPGVYLGLRVAESYGRKRNMQTRGHIYQKASGEVVCQPLANWTGLDVYAYLFKHGIEPFALYKCVRLHESPERVRKSWWLPGSASRQGGMEWLRCYYPSLFLRLCQIMPNSDTAA